MHTLETLMECNLNELDIGICKNCIHWNDKNRVDNCKSYYALTPDSERATVAYCEAYEPKVKELTNGGANV